MPGTKRVSYVNLALIGFGGVARQFVELLGEQRQVLKTRHGLCWKIVGIATATRGTALAPAGVDTEQALELGLSASVGSLHDPSEGTPPRDTHELLDRLAHQHVGHEQLVVVENTPLGLKSGLPGVDHARLAIQMGADVITANKGPVAFAYRELQDRATAKGVSFLFEGTVLDGLPVFSFMRESFPAVKVRSFRGIVNTTTNYLLSAMEEGRLLDEALTEMQAAGISETDPTTDVDGWDAAAKAAILANVLMGEEITPHEVERVSLRSVTLSGVQKARGRGRRLKLVASACWRNGRVVVSAKPEELATDDPLALLSGTASGLVLDTDQLGEIWLSKPVGCVAHTAYGLLTDLITAHKRRQNIEAALGAAGLRFLKGDSAHETLYGPSTEEGRRNKL